MSPLLLRYLWFLICCYYYFLFFISLSILFFVNNTFYTSIFFLQRALIEKERQLAEKERERIHRLRMEGIVLDKASAADREKKKMKTLKSKQQVYPVISVPSFSQSLTSMFAKTRLYIAASNENDNFDSPNNCYDLWTLLAIRPNTELFIYSLRHLCIKWNWFSISLYIYIHFPFFYSFSLFYSSLPLPLFIDLFYFSPLHFYFFSLSF